MACSSGFGSCLCFDDSWTFRLTFQFPSLVNKFALDCPIEITETLNARSGGDADRENVSLHGMLKEETLLNVGVPFAGKYFFLNTAEITRKFRAGDIIAITKFERTGLAFDEAFRRRHATYPVDPVWTGTSEFQRHCVVMPDVFFDIILPPKEKAVKVEHAGGYHAQGYSLLRSVGKDEFPAVYDLNSAGEPPLRTSTRHLRVNNAIRGPFTVGSDIGDGTAMIVLASQYGPVRWDQTNELYPPSGGFLNGEFWSAKNDLNKSARSFEGAYGYYFKEDFVYWLHTTGHIFPGMDWWASHYWSGQAITIEGRVTR